MNNITLQINLSAGDIDYADLMVRDLVSKHKEVNERLLIVDCCRPQKTKNVDPKIRFPEPEYTKRINNIKDIASNLYKKNIVDSVYYINPGDPLLTRIAKKYLHPLFSETHDAKSTPVLSYLVPLELISTRYMVHYDADMLLYQKNDYSWVLEAIKIINNYTNVIFATPRVSPPFEKFRGLKDSTSLHVGPEATEIEEGWLINWFSTRCFLIDNYKLQNNLPLVDYKIFIELVFRKIFQRSFPMATEMLFHKKLGNMGFRRLDLKSEDSWLIHPENKDEKYISHLPLLLEYITKNHIPYEQRGWENFNNDLWNKFLEI